MWLNEYIHNLESKVRVQDVQHMRGVSPGVGNLVEINRRLVIKK